MNFHEGDYFIPIKILVIKLMSPLTTTMFTVRIISKKKKKKNVKAQEKNQGPSLLDSYQKNHGSSACPEGG